MQEECDQRTRQNVMGRPAVTAEVDQLRFFVDNGFKVKDIALLLGCSKRTVERRMNTYQLSTRNYTTICDADLDELVRGMTSVFPTCGWRLMDGRLRAQGIHVQRERVRESLRRVDPSGVDSRMRRVLRRRTYHVESPNSLWHIDGYHKLIRWGLVIHGGIDGYSRLITFLRVSNNNRSETVLGAFLEAIDEFWTPLKSPE